MHILAWKIHTKLDNSSGYEQTLRENNMQLTELQFYTNNITRCLSIVVLLYARRQDHQFITLTIALLPYKSIIHKSHNKPNQYILLTMSSSRNTQSSSMTNKGSLAISPATSITSPSLPKYDFDHVHSKMQTMNENISQ